MTRDPIFAAQGWYPSQRNTLEKALESYVSSDKKPGAAQGIIAPHAGYQFSGPVAGKAYALANVPESALIFAVNHHATHDAPGFSLWSGGLWRTPIGDAKIDEEMREALAEGGLFTLDTSAHMFEHSAELQVPFLLYRNPNVKINVVCVSDYSLERLIRAGELAAETARDVGRDILFVGSGDFSHESFKTAEYNFSQDKKAFPHIEKVAPREFFLAVSENGISTCGKGTFTATLAACRKFGSTGAVLAAYASSARSAAPQDYVVSYASFVIR